MSNNIYTKPHRKNLVNYWRQFIPNWEIPKGFHVHHIVPRCAGGSDDAKNLIALHPDDHASIHRLRGDIKEGNLLKMSDTQFKKGHKPSKITRLKMSKSRQGKTPWNKGKKQQSTSGDKNPSFVGYYHTPWGKVVNCKNNYNISVKCVKNWCKKSEHIININNYSKSKYLKSIGPNVIGKTFKDIGFWFEGKKPY